MENAVYLFAAFAVIWIVVFVYVLSLMYRQNKLRREIDYLKNAIENNGKNRGSFQ